MKFNAKKILLVIVAVLAIPLWANSVPGAKSPKGLDKLKAKKLASGVTTRGRPYTPMSDSIASCVGVLIENSPRPIDSSPFDMEVTEDGVVSFNGGPPTPNTGSNSLEKLLGNIEVTEEGLVAKYKAKRLLSIGEGLGSFVPHFASLGLDVKGLDLWYDLEEIPDTFHGEMMREYRDKNRHLLITGSAQNIPTPNNTFDFIMSHRVFMYIHGDEALQAMDEIVRVLRPGGEARLFHVEEPLILEDYLKARYGERVETQSKGELLIIQVKQ